MTTALIVFAKAPVAGLAKTRLIPALGPEGAANLAERLLEHTLQQARALPVEHLELCVSPNDQHPAFGRACDVSGDRLHLTLQGEGDLGQRMYRALSRVLAGVDLVVVSPQALAPYSGMVPGWLAGTYGFEEIVIDFPALCGQAGARWVSAAIDRLDPDTQCVHLDNGESLRYDWLSLNTGSTLTPPEGESSAHVLSMRPLSQLRIWAS